VPLAGSFFLDFSKLNGSDTLGATGGSIEIQDVQIASINISEGSPVTQGIFTIPTPASMSCSLIVDDFTSTLSQNYLIGTPSMMLVLSCAAVSVLPAENENLPDISF